MALDTIRKLLAALVLASGAACAGSPQVKVINIMDFSNVKDASYRLCKDEQFVLSARDLERYLSMSKKVTIEQWTELDHFPCEKTIEYEKNGVRLAIRINLSGAGVSTVGKKARFFACDEICKQASGWQAP
jgi:hypothetical protein